MHDGLRTRTHARYLRHLLLIVLQVVSVWGLSQYYPEEGGDFEVFRLRQEDLDSAGPRGLVTMAWLKFLPDVEENLTFDQVRSEPWASRFQSNRNKRLPKGVTHYWVRLELESHLPFDRELLLRVQWDDIALYAATGPDSWEVRRSGRLMPVAERYSQLTDLQGVPLIPMYIKAGSRQMIYWRVSSERLKPWWRIDARFLTYERLELASRDFRIGQGFFFGVAMALALYHLVVFFVVRERSYLFYVLYSFGFGLLFFQRYGFGTEYAWTALPWIDKLYGLFTVPTALCYLEFTRVYLKTAEHTPRGHRLLAVFMGLFCVFWVIDQDGHRWINTAHNACYVIACLVSLVIAFLCLRRGQPTARNFLIANAVFLAGCAIYTLALLGMLPLNSFTRYGIQISFLWQQVLFAVGLAERINTLRAEKVKAQAEALSHQQRSIESLKRTDRLKDEFLANTSHELRTPLNGIIGLAESLIDGATGKLPDKTRANLAMIVSSGRRLAHLVNDILDFSKLKNKNLELRLAAQDLYALSDVVLVLSKPLVGEKDLKLVNAVPRDLPPVAADENRLQQILHNLVGNAVKFTASGSVTVFAEVVGERNQVLIRVSDTGIGIAEDQLETIFQSFEQGDGSTERNFGGTGLGLTITRQLVELHGGTIRVESREGQGSSFYFTLPVSSETPGDMDSSPMLSQVNVISTEQAGQAAVIENDLASHGQARILIVDDEPVNRQVALNHLSVAHFRVVQAANGREALDLLEHDQDIDLVLLDIMMPGMSGYEVCRRVRNRLGLDKLPIIFMTARNQLSDLVDGFASGANDYLTKPISRDELISRVGTHLSLKKLVQESLVREREQARMATEIARRSKEMEEARLFQMSMLPSRLPDDPDLDVAVFMRTAAEVGGDYYDFLQTDDGTLTLAVGDATGHGLAAGTMVAATKSLFNILATDPDPSRIMALASRALKAMGLRKMFMALTIAHFKDRRMKIATAGMPRALIVHRDGTMETLQLKGIPLGGVLDFPYEQKEILLQPGDALLFMSDGYGERFNKDRQMFGFPRAGEVFAEVADRPAGEIIKHMVDQGDDWAGDRAPDDDITLVVIKVRDRSGQG